MNLNAGKDERLNNLLSQFQLNNHLVDNEDQCTDMPSFDPTSFREALEMDARKYMKTIGLDNA